MLSNLFLRKKTGMMLLASSTELITLYVALELTALPIAALAAFIRESRSAESGMKFLVLSAVSSAVLLYGMVLVYGFTGSSQLNEIGFQISKPDTDLSPALMLGIVLITAGFGFKIFKSSFPSISGFWSVDIQETGWYQNEYYFSRLNYVIFFSC